MPDTEVKLERKPTKGKPWVVVEEAQSWGPCLCERKENGGDEENHHKTVMVEARTWPGINKPGGVARITKRIMVEEEICGERVKLALYSVRYLLGGSEKEVRETYISCTPKDDGEARKTCPPELFTVPVEEPRPRRSKAGESCRVPQAPPGARAGSSSGFPAPSPSAPASTPRDCSKTVAKASVSASSRSTSTSTSSCPSSSSSRRNSNNNNTKNNAGRPPACNTSSSSSSSGLMSSRENKLTKARVLGETGHNRSRNKGEVAVAKKVIDHGGTAPRRHGCLSGPEQTSKANGSNGFKRKRDLAAAAIPMIPDRLPPVVHRGDSELLEECDDPGKAPCPLDERRMSFIAEAVFKVFERAKTDKVSLPALKKGIEELLPDGMKSFEEAEQQAALKFLEDQENKIMVSDQEVYRI